MGAQGLRCLNRYPSVLPSLAVAKTRTHHRDGTGCWGREMSKAGIRKVGGQGRSEGKKRRREREKGRMGQGQGEDERYRGVEGKRKEKAKELQGKEAFRKEEEPREEGGTLTQPFPSAAPFPVVQGRNGKQTLVAATGQMLLARSLSATWVPI